MVALNYKTMTVSDLEALWHSTNELMEQTDMIDYGRLLRLLDRIEYEIADRASKYRQSVQPVDFRLAHGLI